MCIRDSISTLPNLAGLEHLAATASSRPKPGELNAPRGRSSRPPDLSPVSYTHLRAHETRAHL
eukprot:6363855-Alexandrium_andersonii.AAC.1